MRMKLGAGREVLVRPWAVVRFVRWYLVSRTGRRELGRNLSKLGGQLSLIRAVNLIDILFIFRVAPLVTVAPFDIVSLLVS